MQPPKLAIGTAQFGMAYGVSNAHGQLSVANVHQILDRALAGNVTVIDTAAAYGDAESRLGTYTQLSKFQVVSKLRPDLANGTDTALHALVLEEIQGSLVRLGLDNLYGYLLHRPDLLHSRPVVWDALRVAKERGWVHRIGFSVYSPGQCQALIDKGYVPDLVQAPFSLFDQRFVAAFDSYERLGIEIHVRSVFLQGAPFLSSAQRLGLWGYDPAPFAALTELCARHGVQPAECLLAYALSNANIAQVVVGVDSVRSFEENLAVKDNLLQKLGLDHAAWPHYAVQDEQVLLPTNWKQTHTS